MAKANAKKSGFNPRTIKHNDLSMVLKLAYETQDSIMVWGAPGIGKSDGFRRFADEQFPLKNSKSTLMKLVNFDKQIDHTQKQLEAETKDSAKEKELTARLTQLQAEKKKFESKLIDQEFNFIDFRLSQIEPTDLRGIPVPHETNGGKLLVHWCPPAMLTLPEDWVGVILFDELNSAIPIVQAAAYQLFLDRRVGELVIPDGALITAAGNRDSDNGVTFAMANPLADRMTHFELVADFDQFKAYALRNNIEAGIIAFLDQSPDALNTLGEDTNSYAKGSTPRSLTVMSDYEHTFARLVKSGEMTNSDVIKMRQRIAEGRLGQDIANKYCRYREDNMELLTPEEILSMDENKHFEFKKEWGTSHIYFMLQSTMSAVFDEFNKKAVGEISEEEYSFRCGNFLRFLHELVENMKSEEFLMMGLTQMVGLDRTIFKNVKYFSEISKRYRTVFEKLTSL